MTILTGVENCGLHKRTPYGISPTMGTMFSVARFAGGCKYNGDHYTYFPHTDELVRDDVLRWIKKNKPKTKFKSDKNEMRLL